jgi:hypothetical protein
LPCKREVTVAQVLDRLRGVTIQRSFRGDAVLRGIVPVVALIIKGSGNPLIVGRNGTSSKQRATVVLAMVHFSDGIRLHQVLSGVPDIVNDAKVRLQDCVPIPERRVKRELVAQRGSASSYVATGGNADLIEHVVIEVVLVWADAGLFVRVNAQRGNQAFYSVSILHERVNVRGVG